VLDTFVDGDCLEPVSGKSLIHGVVACVVDDAIGSSNSGGADVCTAASALGHGTTPVDVDAGAVVSS